MIAWNQWAIGMDLKHTDNQKLRTDEGEIDEKIIRRQRI
jgi:hypothetical protein